MTPTESRHLQLEAYRRLVHKPAAVVPGEGVVADLRRKLRTRLFPQQLAFMDDTAKSKAAQCTRRAGKTTVTESDIVDGALDARGCMSLYVTLTREKAKELLWEGLKRLSFEMQLGARFNEVELTMTLPEGLGKGVAKLTGADKAKEIEKRRGNKYRRVRIDEAQAIGEHLRPLVVDVIEPATIDVQGDIGLLGTPGVVCAGYYHDVCTGKEAGWSVHRWSILDNPHVPHAATWLAQKRLERGWTDDNPTYRREWLGEWVNDSGALFYRFDASRNVHQGLPAGHAWRYVMGVDLGFNDAFAIVVWAYARTCPTLYEVDTFKASGLIPSRWAEEIRFRYDALKPDRVVVDSGGLGKAFVEEMKQRHKLPVQAAEKTSKAAFVELLNGDLLTGRVMVRAGSELAKEWAVLPKDADDPTKEDSRFANHAADAALYGWREALHFIGRTPEEGPRPGTPEFEEARMRAHEERLAQSMARRLQEEREEEDLEW